MNRRNFLSLTGTLTGGLLVLPDFLYAYGQQTKLYLGNECVVFVQLNGGNDGLNTFIPFQDERYNYYRPKIALSKKDIIESTKTMGWHPALQSFAEIQQKGHLSVLQNVGYPEPNRSHFRSQEIWQTATSSNQYSNEGWLGKYLDLQCKEHNPTAAINLDSIDNLALKGVEPNAMTVRDPNRFKTRKDTEDTTQLSANPQLDFVRKIANSVTEGAEAIQNALAQSTSENSYPKTGLSKNLEWIARLIKGNLNSKVYYTSLSGFDTHDNQLAIHQNKLTELNDAVYAFYKDMQQANLLSNVTLVIFSEFGRRVQDNGNGTDHGTAAPMFIVGGNNHGKVLGKDPDLANLKNGDLQYTIDFRSVYASILADKLHFDPTQIGIKNPKVNGLF